MATATVQDAKPITTLVLDEAEAIVLLNITMRIAGPHSGPRGCANRISRALQDAGVPIVAQSAASNDKIEFVSGLTRVP
jgi:hypothetical protein